MKINNNLTAESPAVDFAETNAQESKQHGIQSFLRQWEIGFFLFFILSFIGCIEKNNKVNCRGIKEVDKVINLVKWKNDSFGCNGYRELIIDSDKLNFSLLKSIKEECIIELLGKPNKINKYSTVAKYSYFITCGYPPNDKINQNILYERDAYRIVIAIDKLEGVYSVDYLKP